MQSSLPPHRNQNLLKFLNKVGVTCQEEGVEVGGEDNSASVVMIKKVLRGGGPH